MDNISTKKYLIYMTFNNGKKGRYNEHQMMILNYKNTLEEAKKFVDEFINKDIVINNFFGNNKKCILKNGDNYKFLGDVAPYTNYAYSRLGFFNVDKEFSMSNKFYKNYYNKHGVTVTISVHIYVTEIDDHYDDSNEHFYYFHSNKSIIFR